MINGINNSLTEPDALDRSILTEFERISAEHRKEESKVEAEFEEMRPKFLGYILDILVKALQNQTNCRINQTYLGWLISQFGVKQLQEQWDTSRWNLLTHTMKI